MQNMSERTTNNPTTNKAQIDAQWARVRARLRQEVGELAYRSWLKPLTLGELRDNRLRLVVPTRFMRDWINGHYAERLHALWASENNAIAAVEVCIQPAVPLRKPEDEVVPEAAPATPAAEARKAPAMLRNGTEILDDDISAPLDPRFTFKNFVVGKPN